MHIFAGCRSPESATELKAIRENDKRVHVLQLDVTNDESIQNAAKQVEAIVGRVFLQSTNSFKKRLGFQDQPV